MTTLYELDPMHVDPDDERFGSSVITQLVDEGVLRPVTLNYEAARRVRLFGGSAHAVVDAALKEQIADQYTYRIVGDVVFHNNETLDIERLIAEGVLVRIGAET